MLKCFFEIFENITVNSFVSSKFFKVVMLLRSEVISFCFRDFVASLFLDLGAAVLCKCV